MQIIRFEPTPVKANDCAMKHTEIKYEKYKMHTQTQAGLL